MRLFQDNFIYGEATFSQFFRVTTSTQQSLSRSCYFFRTAAFLRSSFFRTVTFSLLLFQISFIFRAKLLQSNYYLRIGSYLGQLLSKQLFLAEELFLKKDIYRGDTFSKQVLLHIINFSRKATYWKKLITQKSSTLYYLLFQESCLFRVATFSKDATFHGIYFFRRPALLQDTFSEEIFHSYASFPQLHYLFIC